MDSKDKALRDVVELISPTWSREECHRQYMLLADHLGDWVTVVQLMKGKTVAKANEKEPLKDKGPLKEKELLKDKEKEREATGRMRDLDLVEDQPASKKARTSSGQACKPLVRSAHFDGTSLTACSQPCPYS